MRLERGRPGSQTSIDSRIKIRDFGLAKPRGRWTTSRDLLWMSPLEPRLMLALARLLDKTGDAAGAREQYERFSALWTDADPGLPESAEAARRLKR